LELTKPPKQFQIAFINNPLIRYLGRNDKKIYVGKMFLKLVNKGQVVLMFCSPHLAVALVGVFYFI